MTITVNNLKLPVFHVRASSMKDGCAYLDEYGCLFICNKYGDTIAVSVCGNCVVWEDHSGNFREVNIEITVTEM